MFQKAVLIIGILVAGYIALRALTAPEGLLAGTGIAVSNADGRNEIRAQYGGFYLAVAAALLLSLFGRLPVSFGLGVLLLAVGGVLVGRLASIVIEGPAVFASYSAAIKTYLAFDIAIVVLTLLALRREWQVG